ncbi:MAG TPA: SDR family NAD(P)-dependent oxidoreductase [Humisphaera sp.]|jgi:NAD(P)-dependent dehydrogenase (short-subunit alcohol dehydrogenase family)|nr:SDR family NAD(P)-dependent oxidoreductase [Humisphaera sp.]
MMNIDFSNRHVVVTGGTGALGAAVAQLLLDGGATVHIPAHRAPDPLRFPLARHERVKIAAPVDLANEQAVSAFYQSLPPLWGSIHTAGGFAAGALIDTTLADFRGMFEINAVTAFLCCREAARKIGAGGEGGRLVNVAARPAVIPVAGLCAYSASKAAVANLTQALAEELAPQRIWVNAVLPSIMDTPANRQAMPKADFAKWPKVTDVAATVAFLASPQNAVTRGALVEVYGQS